MYFLTLLVGIWLLPKGIVYSTDLKSWRRVNTIYLMLLKANTLKCYECVPGTSETCTDTAKECPSPDNLCAAMTLVTYTGGAKDKEIKAKMCSLARDCVEGSVNFGSDKTAIVSECCTSDLCNTLHISEPKSIPNGKKCYSCERQQCSKTLNCEGDQDYCITSRMNVGGEIQTLKGCASQMMCLENPSVFFQTYIGSGSSCCQGDFCNSASSASASLFLLFMLLIVFVFFCI